ncbi:unnamed protein product [Schistosoma mattheei]|uniref:Uncharacterized protein n=1 Tax=Schistosoma mattheei TaxID=31246 RepID=A0A183PDJ9_9TREM|nr:unnamed protein product [Schistosoma mattheei]
METLKKRISKMEEEIVIFSDLDKVRENAVLKRQSLNEEKSRLERYRDNLNKLNQQLSVEHSNLQTYLTGQDIYIQLTNLERRWAQHEEINYSLNEFITNKRKETDPTQWVKPKSTGSLSIRVFCVYVQYRFAVAYCSTRQTHLSLSQ